MNQNRVHSYSSIADQNQVDKRTVQSWVLKHKQNKGFELGELFNGVRLFNDEEKEILEAYKKPVYKPQIAETYESIDSDGNNKIEKPPQVNVEILNGEIEEPSDLDRGGSLALNGTYDLNTAIAGILGVRPEKSIDTKQCVDVVFQILDVTERAINAEETRYEMDLSDLRKTRLQLSERKTLFTTRVEISKNNRKRQAREKAGLERQIEKDLTDITSMGKQQS